MSATQERTESYVEAPEAIGVHHVCVCHDGSPLSNRVLPHGLALARAFGASLTVLHVLEAQRGDGTLISTNPLDWEMQRSHARAHLDGISAEYGSPELPVKTVLLEGRVAEEICGWVASHDVHLTVLCSHGASGWTDWSLGSTAKKLIEGLSGPTLLVPACVLEEPRARDVMCERILVPLDGSPRAESALPLAASLARMQGFELVLVHAVPVPELTRPAPLNEEELALERRLIDRNTRVGRDYLARVAERLIDQGLRVRTILAAEDVRSELLRCIAEERPNLVVISAHGQSARTELPLGSVTSFLIEHATAPILIVRERANERESLMPKRRDAESGRPPPLVGA